MEIEQVATHTSELTYYLISSDVVTVHSCNYDDNEFHNVKISKNKVLLVFSNVIYFIATV